MGVPGVVAGDGGVADLGEVEPEGGVRWRCEVTRKQESAGALVAL